MYRLNEIQLPPRQVNVGTRRCLAANVARFAYDQDRKIRIFCRIGSLIKVLIAIADKFAAFLVPYLRFADLLFDPFQDRDRVFRFSVAGPPIARVRLVCRERADHGNTSYVFADGQSIVIVFQKYK